MKILAVVVTHNRRDLLERCLNHIKAQSCPPTAILVVNNASTDGTVEMLERDAIPFVTQENLGSAGGWHRGIQYALNHGFDAVWLMDDDGFPDRKALATLKAAMLPGVACASSIVLREDQPSKFVFPFPVLDRAGLPILFAMPRKLFTVDELRARSGDLVYPFAHFFNGALISVVACLQIGNINRDFFMYGDEVDYFFRLRNAGRVVSVINAVHFHPDVSQRPISADRFYYYLKNTLVLNALYFNMVWLRHFLAILAVLGRTVRRNGVLCAISFLCGPDAPTFYLAVVRGLQGKVGKDFHE